MERQEQLSCVNAADQWYCGMQRPEERLQFQQNLNLGREKFLCFYRKRSEKSKNSDTIIAVP